MNESLTHLIRLKLRIDSQKSECGDDLIGKIEQKRQYCVGNVTKCSSASASMKDDVQVWVGQMC